ncbi:Cystathionine beta-lyase PatB [Vibrio thalassae]|uniref:cysteine-S-conjugate beta-lyase n=1 Tax=Vibrio thalassae TaxID=1243014 RepID=A0A240EK44_9VIBR|nr:PatB family C-S lyase [Vibrio thalassae]SNX48330.1 Cystathionine beta-lyase PatB [Vibrio thalassae]
MFKVTSSTSATQNNFIKHDSAMLNQFYGTNDVVPYWVADMDFPIANPITQELQRLVDREVYAYEFDSSRVFAAIARWNETAHNLSLDPNHFVQVPGVLSAIALLIREFTQQGDGVLIQTPVYHQFRRLIESAGRVVAGNSLKIEDGHYTIDFDDFEQQLKRGNAKMVLLCNPHNPVGRVWTRSELQTMVDIARRYDVIIVSDEIHADIVFDDHTFTSIVSLRYEKAVSIIGSPAKNFGLNSIANGYIYTDNDALYQQIKSTVSSLAIDHGNALTTYATIAAYEKGREWFEGYLQYTQTTVHWIAEFVASSLPDITMYKPEGTNQIWFDFSKLQLAPDTLKSLLVNEAKMGLTPGAWFGETNPNYYRMNIAVDREQIQASFARLHTAINSL